MDVRFVKSGVAVKSAFSSAYALWDVSHSFAWPRVFNAVFDEYEMTLTADGVYPVISQEALQTRIYQCEKTLADTGEGRDELAAAHAKLLLLQSISY